jgi:putative AdoMet-dependent methyltransferase
MRSSNADRFNHDDAAESYDVEVGNESALVRRGYRRTLDWVAARVTDGDRSQVLELGCGTGNLSAVLPTAADLLCVDISSQMLAVAREKLKGRPRVRFLQADLLECWTALTGPFDAVVSTYAVHHLTDDEKRQLLDECVARLKPAGRLVIGDLMFGSAADREQVIASLLRKGEDDLVEEIKKEFYWQVDLTLGWLTELGLSVEAERISTLSWAFCARTCTY